LWNSTANDSIRCVTRPDDGRLEARLSLDSKTRALLENEVNPFLTHRAEQEVFDELEALCSTSGYIHALACISLRDNLVSYDGELTGEAMAASYAPERTIRTEFSTLMGLLLKHPIDFGLPFPAKMQELIDKTRTLLGELHACLNQCMFDSIKTAFAAQQAGLSVEATRPLRRGNELREPIFYGGESAYSFQYREFTLDRYGRDDDWLLKNMGFEISDGHAVTGGLVRLQNRKVLEAIRSMPRRNPSEWTALPGFTFSLDEIAIESGISPDSATAVLAALTAPSAPTNESFTSLGEFNIANALPILRTPTGDYVSLQSYGIAEALYDSPFYWMASDKNYRDTAFTNRGAFTENFVAKRLTEVFGADKVHQNVNILRKGNRIGEVDVLILFANRAVVIQCKSKRLTLEARKGNDLQLRSDFKKSVQDAYDQALLCSRSLGDRNLKFQRIDGSEISLPALREIYPVCVVSDHYPALTTQADEFLKYETNETIQPPLITDVFLVDVLAEMLTSPLQLLSYIDRRVNIGQRVHAINELTILGCHLTQNLWFEDGFDQLMLDDSLAIELDTAMTVRREGVSGSRTPKGILTHLDGTLVGRMIKAIENRAEAELVDLGFMLLTLGGESLKILNRGLEEIAKQTRLDGRTHDLTLNLGDGDTGLTVHCGTLSNAEAAEKLARHCELRKYVCQAGSWFGLVVRAEDGLPKFGLNLRFPWKQDDVMDEATKNMGRGRKPSHSGPLFLPHKIGRNEQCPCGSEKKFKKCCVDRLREDCR
jgi:SEC-C motif